MVGPGSFLATVMGFAFLAIVMMRILVCAAAIEARPLIGHRLSDDRLPLYSIVVALYREARIVPQLVAALERISYPGIMAQTPPGGPLSEGGGAVRAPSLPYYALCRCQR